MKEIKAQGQKFLAARAAATVSHKREYWEQAAAEWIKLRNLILNIR